MPLPLYTIEELSLTVTGAPIILLKNPLGSLLSDVVPFSMMDVTFSSVHSIEKAEFEMSELSGAVELDNTLYVSGNFPR